MATSQADDASVPGSFVLQGAGKDISNDPDIDLPKQAPPDGPRAVAAHVNQQPVVVDLPGVGPTYLDAQFAPYVSHFQDEAARRGLSLTFTSGYRSPEHQAWMRDNGVGTTPARDSLHEAGWAVDVHTPPGAASQARLHDAAQAAGLDWGGRFRKPDPVHYYVDPDPSHRRGLVDGFTGAVDVMRKGGIGNPRKQNGESAP
jgi:hypothetical protein